MRIQTRLKLGAMASTAVAIIIFVAIVLTAQRINTDLKRGNLYSELENRVYTLQLQVNDFLLHPERHEQSRWSEVHGSIENLLNELQTWYRADGVTLDEIRANHQDLSPLFLQLEATRVSPEFILPRDVTMATAGRLMGKLDAMAREASRLKELNEAGTVKSQRNFALLLVFLLLLLVITTGTILYVASNHITRSLAALDLGTRIISEGNFEYRIKIDADDEIGDLALAFNRMAGQLRETYNVLREEIIERRNAEEALRLDEARLEALFQMSQLTGASRQQLAEFTLEQGVRLTRSRIGFLGFMSEDETVLTLQTWSDSVMGMCAMHDAPVRFQVLRAGLWAEAVRQRKPIVVNDYRSTDFPRKGLPEGHVPLQRVMVAPVFDGNSRIVALAAVGNKEEEYNAADLRQFTLHMDGMWKIIQHEQAEKALRQGESLAAMGRALSCVAHDIKTPLVAIGGLTRLVREHLKTTNPEDCSKLDVVIREVRRLENLVRDMLDFTRPLELNLSPEDISGIVRESIEVVEEAALDRNVQVLYYPSEELLPVFIDTMRMKQVVINLVLNAVQASPEGETVFVRSCLSGSLVLLEIADRGCGIPYDKRESVFTPFFTTKREGTGLGLPIVKKIVETHQGTVQILDNPDRGITFRVAIPIA